MKNFIVIAVLLVLVTLPVSAQEYRKVDKSAIDIAYYPDYFAHDRKDGDEIVARVIYSRPQKNDREIFGGLVKYDKVWRTGANENTEIQFYKDVKFGGKSLKAGTYSLFTIPGKDKWTIIINSDILYWGAYSYNEENDVLRVEVEAGSSDEVIEALSIAFAGEGNNFKMYLAWDNTEIEVPISY